MNLAARIQAVASPDSVVVAELTRRLAGAAFDYEGLGLHELKGFTDAAKLWRVTGESTARGRFDSRVVGGLTPLVGRAEEIALLLRRWDHAKAGDGQLILLSAPAGFGKSRMTQAFREHLDGSSVICLQYFGSPFHVNSAFYPFIRQLEWAAGIVRTDTGAQKLDKLEAILEGSAESKIEEAALMADSCRFLSANAIRRCIHRGGPKATDDGDAGGATGPDLAAGSGAGYIRGRALDRSNVDRVDEQDYSQSRRPAGDDHCHLSA